MKICKRLLCAFLAAVMLTGALPTLASAAGSVQTMELVEDISGTLGENLIWTLTTDGTLTISGEGEMASCKWGSAPWISYNQWITAAVICEGVTSISDGAFSSCEKMASVTIADSVTSIGEYAFDLCVSLSKVAIPANVASIDERAFDRCEKLAEITVDAANAHYCSVDGVLFTKDMTTLVRYPAYSERTTYSVPDGVEVIGVNAFSGSFRLTDITLPESVTTIKDGAFSVCTGLLSMTLPKNVKTIEDGAFSECEKLARFTIEGDIENFGSWGPFGGCDLFVELIIGSGVTTLNSGFYREETLEKITVESGNENYSSIDGMLYNKDQTLLIRCPASYQQKSVTLPDSVTDIEAYAFEENKNVETVIIPDSVVNIYSYAFHSCDSLKKVTIPGSVKNIYSYAFAWCWELEELTLSEGLEFIGAYAFNYCEKLRELTIPGTVTTLGDYSFSICDSLETVTIPASVTSVGTDVFSWCDGLKSAEIHSAMVGAWMFEDCVSLTTVTIGEETTYIQGPDAFYGCTSLETVYMGKNITKIGGASFRNCPSLSVVYYSGTQEQWDAISIGSNNDDLLAAVIVFGNIGKPTLSASLDANGKPVLSWSAVDDATEYEVWYANKGDTDFVHLTTTAQLSYTHDEAAAGATYSYMVRAVTADGSGPFSDLVSVVCMNSEDAALIERARETGMLEYMGIINADESVTRLDAAKLFAALAQLELSDETLSFTDCDDLNDEEKRIIAAVVNEGLIIGYDDGSYGPEDTVTRAEMAVLIYRYLTGDMEGKNAGLYAEMVEFDDVFSDDWFAGYVAYCVQAGVIDGDSSRFRPSNKVIFRDTLSWLINTESAVEVPEPTLTLDAPVVSAKLNADELPVISWNAVENAQQYEVWCRLGEDGDYNLLATTDRLSLTHTEAQSGATYFYKVRAVSGEVVSEYSNEVAVEVPEELVLPSPTVKATNVASSGKIKLTWSKVDGAEKYEVWRATSENGTYTKLTTTSKTSITNTSTTAGKTYYYKVRAIAGDVQGEFSEIVSRTCDLARPTVKTTNIASTGKIKISWNKVDGAVKYEVYRATSKNGKYTKLTTTTKTSVTNSKTEAGKTYYYRVKAIASTSAANSAASAAVGRTCDLARPTVTVKLNSKGKPVVSWNKISGAVKYEVYRATSENGKYTKLTTTTKTSITNSKAEAGVTYYYKVRAIASTSAANSAYSAVAYITAK